MKLTDATARDLPTTGKDQFVTDDDLPGFGLRVRKSGAKFWAYQFRRHGRLRRVVLGRIEVLDSAKARTRAKVALGKVADGQDPTVRRVGVTCDEVFALWTRSREAAGKWHGRTAGKYAADWRLHLAPRLGKLAVELVDETVVAKIVTTLHDRRGAAGSALRLLRAVLNFAERKKLRPRGSNPVRDDDLYRSPRRVTRLSAEDYRRVGAALDQAEADGTCPAPVALCLRLLALTGARKLEIAAATWDQYDAREGALRLTESKTGPRLVVLPQAARALLAAAPRLDGNPHIIHGYRATGRAGNVDRAWYKVRAAAGMPALRIHDLRHGWATTAAELGIAYPLVAAALGHVLSGGMTSGYVHVAASSLRGPVDTVGAWIADALAGREPNVVAFPTTVAR